MRPAAVLVKIDGGRFARCAHDHQAVGLLGDVEFDQCAITFPVEASVLEHGGDKRDQATFNHVDGVLPLKNAILPQAKAAWETPEQE